jgi:Zn-dependent protease with chaperone function
LLPVYLIDEDGINAFAAGYRSGDAVIGITKGAILNLDRDQLQGVVAPEFSHILNADMKLNIRLIGLLHGILMLSIVGRIMLESKPGFARRASQVFPVIFLGISLFLIGYPSPFG